MASKDPNNKIDQLAARAEFEANELLQVVSNDLLAPLTTIKSMASRIAELTGGESDAAVHACAENILVEGAAMEQLIADLQQGRCEATLVHPAAQRQDVSRLIEYAADIFLPLAESASVRLTTDLRGSLVVKYDAPRLFEALAHLIQTAMNFTPAGSFIRVSASCEGDECLISVVDNGMGIAAPERVAGLCIARSIIEAHGGRLWIDSRSGVGSAFYFALPLA